MRFQRERPVAGKSAGQLFAAKLCGIVGEGVGDEGCHLIDEIEARQVQKRIIEDGFFGDNAHDSDIPYLAEPLICS